MTSTLNTRPVDTSYDTGNDIQPGVSWANPNKDSYPATDATLVKTKTTTVTKTTVTANANTNTNTANTKTAESSVEASLEKNQIPMDKEDPTRRTKALPFANVEATEIRTQIQTEEFPVGQSSSSANRESDSGDDHADLHNGNILDRTMDQIRTWVHSFKNGETQYEEVEVDDHHDNNGPSTIDNAKSQLNATKDTVTAKASSLANSTKDSLSSVANSTTETMNVAGNKLNNIKDTVMHTVNDYTQSASETVNSGVKNVSGQVGQLTDTVKTRANELAHTLSDSASSTINTVKSTVNDYISQHQSSPNESLSTTVTNTISSTLPSQTQLKTLSSNYLPPLMQQASSSYAFLGSFVTNYLMTYQDFFLMLRKQSLPLQMFTVMMFVTHFVLPMFFLDKSAARSVIYCYFLSSVLSHATFFISRSLRYMFLSHLVFVPMLISLTLHQGFSEAGDVSQLIDSFNKGEKVHTMFAAPLSLRSYLFILWLRVVLMNQATMFTLDLVNLSNLLGLSLDTQRGQEGKLISSRVKVFRKKLAQNIHGAAQSIEESSESNSNNNNNNQNNNNGQQKSRRNSSSKYSPAFKSSNLSANVNNGNNSAKTSPQSATRSLSPQPQQSQQQPQQQNQQNQNQAHQQKWVKKDGNESQTTVQTKEFTVESHEKPQQSSNTELRQRTVQQTKQSTQ